MGPKRSQPPAASAPTSTESAAKPAANPEKKLSRRRGPLRLKSRMLRRSIRPTIAAAISMAKNGTSSPMPAESAVPPPGLKWTMFLTISDAAVPSAKRAMKKIGTKISTDHPARNPLSPMNAHPIPRYSSGSGSGLALGSASGLAEDAFTGRRDAPAAGSSAGAAFATGGGTGDWFSCSTQPPGRKTRQLFTNRSY